jgi:hypothetical protein
MNREVRDPYWRRSKLEHGVSCGGDEDVCITWCADCEEERRMYEDDKLSITSPS